ncbi:DUF4097 family beta strand repeat-containing protein [Streptomyces lonarensis]|uniref:DUF4097 domain-containing protein n=1 Tax=Streptomyces lonarensis TaxID=700599 RepID=A0A7X6D2P9_9ACTN|nr:DUF4097 family beta strand repeat-containing protein [Streptomyces lonarensis]NJQ07115.1 DUF4097 domain-containing protein [Streptomyces lonarensis]
MPRRPLLSAAAPLSLAGLLLAALSLTGCTAHHVSVDGEQRTFTVGTTELVVDSGNTDVTVLADASLEGEVLVTRWFDATAVASDASVEWEMDDGGRLTFRADCSGVVTRCSARHEVAVPETMDVRVEGRNGALAAESLTSSLHLTTRNGTITVADVAGPVSLHSRNGTIDASGLTAAEVRAHTRNGSIDLHTARAPELLEAVTHNGSARVEVPGGTAYRVESESRNGAVESSVDEDGADHLISVRTRNGSVEVVPHDG